MWIFLTEAAVSIVADRDDPALLLVRARAPGDIERVFPQAEVFVDGEADYPYRARLNKGVIAGNLALALLGIDYDNFKAAVPDRDRHDAYMEIWSVWNRANRVHRPPRAAARLTSPTPIPGHDLAAADDVEQTELTLLCREVNRYRRGARRRAKVEAGYGVGAA